MKYVISLEGRNIWGVPESAEKKSGTSAAAGGKARLTNHRPLCNAEFDRSGVELIKTFNR